MDLKNLTRKIDKLIEFIENAEPPEDELFDCDGLDIDELVAQFDPIKEALLQCIDNNVTRETVRLTEYVEDWDSDFEKDEVIYMLKNLRNLLLEIKQLNLVF